jgi:hypothetical protein
MGPINKKYKSSLLFSRVGKQIGLIALALLITFGVYFFYHRHQQQTHLYRAPEQNTSKFADQDLKNHDYQSYQMRLTSYANDYIQLQKYDDAKRVLNEIVANVPQDKIISQTYRAYWSLYEHTGDTQNRKKYAKLTADKLRLEGQDKAAAAFDVDAGGK